MKKLALLALLASLMLAFPGSEARAADNRLQFSIGYYDFFDDEEAFDIRVEHRWGQPILWKIKPFIGLEATSDGALYGLGGLYFDWNIQPNWYVTPSIGAGLYADGGGKDLGHPIEFRSQLEVSYEFENAHRLGVSLAHISNADLDSKNPGTEVFSVSYSIPFNF